MHKQTCTFHILNVSHGKGSRLILLELYRSGIFRSVSVGISWYLPYRYRRKTRSVFSVSKHWREPLKTLAGAPFFPRRGGLGPLFVHFALLLKKKRNSRGIIQKKSSRKIFKRCSPKLTLQQSIPTEKFRYRLYLLVGQMKTRYSGPNCVVL